MKINVIRKFLGSIIIIIGINVIAGYAVYKSNQQLRISEHWVSHSVQVISLTENIFSAGKDFESASRAFVLTNDSTYLKPLFASEKTCFANIQQLKQLISDDPAQTSRVDSLSVYMHKRLNYSFKTIGLRSSGGLTNAIEFIKDNKGLYYSDQLRVIMSEIQQREFKLLQQRRNINEKEIVQLNILSEGMLILMSVLAFLLLAVSANFILQNKDKIKRAAELVIANKELAFQNNEKAKLAEELSIANDELLYQNQEKEKQAQELVVANKELSVQNKDKEKRAEELNTANIELAFQNEEKQKHATKLLIINEDLKKTKEEINNLSRLYNLVGKLNENILRVKDEATLFQNSCRIVMELGKFNTAWIGIFNGEQKVISLVSHCGMAYEDIILFTNVPYQENDMHDQVRSTGKYVISNNIQRYIKKEKWKRFGETHGIHSLMMLPVKNGDKVVGILNLYSADPVFATEEEIELLLCVAEDISFALHLFEVSAQQRNMEAQLVQNAKRYQSLVEKGVDMITLRSPDGIIHYASPAVTNVLQRSNSELLNSCIYDLIHPDDMPELLNQVNIILQTPGSNCFRQQRYLNKNGDWIWCEGHITNMMQEPGINAMVTNFRDISEKKRTDDLLEFERNNLNALINNTDDLMWSIDGNLNLISFNEPFAREFYRKNGTDALNGGSVFPVSYPAEKLLRFRQYYKRALAGEEFTETEHVSAPVQKWNELSFFPIHKARAVVGTACFSRDITSAKMGEEFLRNVTVDLSKRINDLEQFTYIISHNLRAPVANILGATYMLKVPEIKDEIKKELEEGINKSALKIDGVIKDLNQILQVKIEISQVKESVHFSELVETIIKGIKDLIDKDSISIQHDFSELDEMITLKKYIYSIFYNLISNSIKYRRPGVPGVVVIKSHLKQSSLVLSFADNGLGIDLEQYGRDVFGLYKRFHDNINGKGVGLFMVKNQVETLGGTIAVNSKVNVGTTFTIEFKLSE